MKKNLILVLFIISLMLNAVLGTLLAVSLLTGEETKVEEKSPEELKNDEINKLDKYLKESGYKLEDGKYVNEIRKVDDEEGKPYNWSIVYVQKDPFVYTHLTAMKMLGINSNRFYNYNTDIASGTFSYFGEDGNLISIVNYTYDFNTGTLTCSADDCSTYLKTANEDKTSLLNIFSSAGVNENLLK